MWCKILIYWHCHRIAKTQNKIHLEKKLKKKTIHCRAEKELFKCKNAKYSHIISRKDVVIDSQANQPIGKDAHKKSDSQEIGVDLSATTEKTTKKSQAKNRHTKLRMPYRSQKSTNTLISR